MTKDKLILGWREWLSLPEFGIRLIKAKVDTGARTSSLHADDIEYFHRGGKKFVRFTVHPKQRTRTGAVHATAPLLEQRIVRSSNGIQELRPVIVTELQLGDHSWPVELTLTSRDVMGFRMLLGRQAIRGYALVDPARSFLTRKVKRKKRKRQKSRR